MAAARNNRPAGYHALFGLLALAHAAICSAANPEFAAIENLAREHFVAKHPDQKKSIVELEAGVIAGGLANTPGIESTADVTLRLRDGAVSRIQLQKKRGRWAVARDLGADMLAEAHPLLVEEITDPMWRETARLQQRVAQDLEDRLRRKKTLSQVRRAYPRCFVALEFGKALCDIWYATWTSDEPECFDTAVLFKRVNREWTRVPGSYHPGMRINPENGEVFEMQPREPCSNN